MKKCKYKNMLCDYREQSGSCSFKEHCGKQIIITNAMKIRSMSDEELRDFLWDVYTSNEFIYGEDWLQSEVKE